MDVKIDGTVKFFSKSKETIEYIMDNFYFDQFGEMTDKGDECVTLVISDMIADNGKEEIVNMIKDIEDEISDIKNVKILAQLIMTDMSMYKFRNCECCLTNDNIKYRETDWNYEVEVDNDMSYEEFEDENNIDVDEDEFEEKRIRHKAGIEDPSIEFNDWEYID